MAQSNEPGFTTAQQKLAHLPATSILAGQLQAALASGDVQALHELFDAQEQQAREAIASWQAIRQRTREEFARTLRSPSTGLPAHIICPGRCQRWLVDEGAFRRTPIETIQVFAIREHASPTLP